MWYSEFIVHLCQKGILQMNILIIDGQGGGVGKQLVTAIKTKYEKCSITSIGTNSAATAAMLKAGADYAATGENAVIVGCRTADIIIGPIGIAIADSLLGEITPAMAAAVGQSKAKKLLIPVNNCNNMIVGIQDLTMNKLVQNVIEMLHELK